MLTQAQLSLLLREAERLAAAGALGEAIARYQRVLNERPDLPDCWYNLGRLLRRAGQPTAALAAYEAALVRGVSAPEEVHLNRGVILSDDLHQAAAAERELRRALSLNPAYLPAMQNLANLEEDLGRREDARGSYERILAVHPEAYESLARYAQLIDVAHADHPLLARLRAALASARAGAAERASLGFALARALDACGAYPEAFAAAAAANEASRHSITPPAHYERAAEEARVAALLATPPRQRTDPSGEASPQPIFICGMYRSGSTLTEQILARHPQVAAAGELELLPQVAQSLPGSFPDCLATLPEALLQQAAARYREGIARLFPQATHVTDKRPGNFYYVGLIKTLFPRARIVHTTRDPLDTALSIFFVHLDPRLAYALDLTDTGHYYRQYRRLMAHWEQLYGGDILDFNYDTLVQEPRAAIERLLAFCGLKFEEACLDFTRSGPVRTASVWQVRRGLYRDSSGRSRHYLKELAPFAAAAGLGYDLNRR